MTPAELIDELSEHGFDWSVSYTPRIQFVAMISTPTRTATGKGSTWQYALFEAWNGLCADAARDKPAAQRLIY